MSKLLTRSEVAAVFRVNPKTVTRWAAAGLLAHVLTPGGHRRYLESEIQERLAVAATTEMTDPDGVSGGAVNTAPAGAPDDL